MNKDSNDSAEIGLTRRSCLASTGAALLGAAAMSAFATEALANRERERDDDEILYGHGMVWNRNLPGIASSLNLSFDMRVNLSTGIGAGTAHDPVHPDYNIHYSVNSATVAKLPGKESLFTLKGVVTEANNPALVGLPVRILAQTNGDTTAIAIAIGEVAFAGAGLVVIAIIAILIALLLPAVQKVR